MKQNCDNHEPGEGFPVCCSEGRYLGHFDALARVLERYPEGGRRGWFFLNEETRSLWMWDILSNAWHDTLCTDNALQGIIDDPASFRPEVRPGIRACYLYVQPVPGEVTFARFLNDGLPVQVTAASTSLVLLFWNGDRWESAVVPFYVDLTPYALADLSNVTRRADALHDGLMAAADKAKLDGLLTLTLDVDAARRPGDIASRDSALGFLDGYSLAALVEVCRRRPSACLFGFRTGEGSELRTGSLDFVAAGGETLSLVLAGRRLAVSIRETVPGGAVQVQVSSRPADISVAVPGARLASYPQRAGYSV